MCLWLHLAFSKNAAVKSKSFKDSINRLQISILMSWCLEAYGTMPSNINLSRWVWEDLGMISCLIGPISEEIWIHADKKQTGLSTI